MKDIAIGNKKTAIEIKKMAMIRPNIGEENTRTKTVSLGNK